MDITAFLLYSFWEYFFVWHTLINVTLPYYNWSLLLNHEMHTYY